MTTQSNLNGANLTAALVDTARNPERHGAPASVTHGKDLDLGPPCNETWLPLVRNCGSLRT